MEKKMSFDEETLEVPELKKPFPDAVYKLPFNVALIIDGLVYEIINCSGEQAAQFLSQPLFIQVAEDQAKVGWKYDKDSGEFIRPRYNHETDTITY
jgi:hypothetical protein